MFIQRRINLQKEVHFLARSTTTMRSKLQFAPKLDYKQANFIRQTISQIRFTKKQINACYDSLPLLGKVIKLIDRLFTYATLRHLKTSLQVLLKKTITIAKTNFEAPVAPAEAIIPPPEPVVQNPYALLKTEADDLLKKCNKDAFLAPLKEELKKHVHEDDPGYARFNRAENQLIIEDFNLKNDLEVLLREIPEAELQEGAHELPADLKAKIERCRIAGQKLEICKNEVQEAYDGIMQSVK